MTALYPTLRSTALVALLTATTSVPAASETLKFNTDIPNFGTVELNIVTPDRTGNRTVMSSRAIAYTVRLMQDWSLSGTNGANAMARLYADNVNFYGTNLRHDQVMKDRYATAEYWPDRNYRINPESIQTRCAEVCYVSATYNFDAYNPITNAHSAGRATIDLTLLPSGHSFLITEESGKVVTHARLRVKPVIVRQ